MLVNTDYFPMSRDNANWLYKMGVLNKNGGIVQNCISMSFFVTQKDGSKKEVSKDTSSWSVLVELVAKARELVSGHDDFGNMIVDGDDMITFLRMGELPVIYEKDGEEYKVNFILGDELKDRVREWKNSIA